jgi:hypothetical protein
MNAGKKLAIRIWTQKSVLTKNKTSKERKERDSMKRETGN